MMQNPELNNQEKKETDLDFPYICVTPYEVMKDKSLEPNAKLLYGCLAGLAKKEGYCWASNEDLSKMYGSSNSQIKRWLDSLEKGDHIKRVTKNKPYKKDGKLLWKRCRKIYVTGGFLKKEYDRCKNEPILERCKNEPVNNKSLNINKSIPKGIPKDEPDGPSLPAAKATSSHRPKAERLSSLLYKKITELNPKTKPPNMKNWTNEMEKILKIDKKESKEVENLIIWVFDKSDFWYKNILSPTKLRKHYDQLFIEAFINKKQDKRKTKHSQTVKQTSLIFDPKKRRDS